MRTLAIGPPTADDIPGTECRWSSSQPNGNLDRFIQVGAGRPVFVGWDGADDGAFHLAEISDDDALKLPGVPLNRINGKWRLAVELDGRGPV